jgi:arylsulfatase A-like enzyme/Flp pilus assembly protein TadD
MMLKANLKSQADIGTQGRPRAVARRRLLPAALLLACVVLCGTMLAAPASAAPPNVVLITIDTVRSDHVGCYGDQDAHTPNLDALAREGVLFQTAVTSVPLTFPSHCSILTGTYPTLHGVRDNLGYTFGGDPPTIAMLLKARGYETAAFVSAEVLDTQRGLNRGFDTYSSPFHRRMGWNKPLVADPGELRRPAEKVVQDALSWMSSQPRGREKPFFIWIHFYDAHLPYSPPPQFRAMLPNPYDAAIAYADNCVGTFLTYLKDHGLYDATLVVAASDHGESFGEHGEHAHGYFIYDTTLLVPLVIKPPARAGIAPRRVNTPVRTIDIAPTLLQMLGLPSASSMQGASLLSLMLGKLSGSTSSAAYCESYYPNEFGWSPLRALRTDRFKYIDAPKPELYDLKTDPQELHNLYATQHATALELKSQFDALVARVTPKQLPPRSAVSAGDIEALASLGYVGTSGPLAEARPGQTLPDPKDELPTEILMTTAINLTGKGKCADVIPTLTRLTEQQPSWVLGQMTLAKCEMATRMYDAAGATLDAALRLHPDNVEAQFYRGVTRFQQGRISDARADLEPLARSLPDDPYEHFYLGSIYERQGNGTQALGEFQRCAAVDPTFEIAVLKIGSLLAENGKYPEAIVQFKKVIEMNPNNASAHHGLALAYQKSGNGAAAGPEFDSACHLNSSYCAASDRQ